MKRWAVVVVALYVLILLVLTGPLMVAAFYPHVNFGDIPEVATYPHYWVLILVMACCQAALLVVPVSVAGRRPLHRRAIIWPALASGLMMGLLSTGFVASLYELVRKDKAIDALDSYLGLDIAVLLGFWLIWALAFQRLSRGAEAMDAITRQCRYLLKGSILELLVAVPTHIVARYRDYCCAGFLTFLGLAFGLSVMIFSFGPGVFLLFVGRWKQLHPQLSTPSGKP